MPRCRAAALAALWIAALAAGASPGAAEGAPRPPARFQFRVPSLSGGTLTSEDFKGKIVIVDVWATWCGPCRMVIPHLSRLHEKYQSRGVAVVGLNSDEPGSAGDDLENVRRFVREMEIAYPIGLMNEQTYSEVARLMGFSPDEGFALPTTLVLGRDGSILQGYPGYYRGQEQDIVRLIEQTLAADSSPPSRR